MKWHTYLLAITCSLLLAAPASFAELSRGAVWIDVRSPGEYESGHLDRASNIPWDGISVGVRALELARDTPIYLYCGSGRRAQKALEQLQLDGYDNVVNAGGLDQARQLATAE